MVESFFHSFLESEFDQACHDLRRELDRINSSKGDTGRERETLQGRFSQDGTRSFNC
jgi:hypothetical protein